MNFEDKIVYFSKFTEELNLKRVALAKIDELNQKIVELEETI